MTNAEKARTLRSAASAVEHGRYSTYRRKLASLSHLDSSDIATILAALRLFQSTYQDMDAVQIADAWPMHFNARTQEECDCAERSWYGEEHDSACPFAGRLRNEDGVTVEPEPLGSEDIDRLCERINCSKVLVLP